MSYPYPQNRRREQREKGEQPYVDAKEAMGQQDAELQAQAEGFGEERQAESAEEQRARFDEEARRHLAEIGEDVARKAEKGVKPPD